MTEAEWLVSEDPQLMLEELRRWPERRIVGNDVGHNCRYSDRLLRLFACGCVRQSWLMLTDDLSRRVVEIAEQHADGQATKEDTFQWASSCMTIARCLMPTWDATEEARMIIETAQIHNRAVLPIYAHLLRDIVGNPFQPLPELRRVVLAAAHMSARALESGASEELVWQSPWLTPAVLAIARTIYEERRFEDMPILGDALEEAGCDNEDILMYCRNYHLRVHTSQSGIVIKRKWLRENMIPHVRGCWVPDLILGYT